MEAILSYPEMSPAQKFVLHTFLTAKNEQDREELTSLYLDYIQRKMDIASDKWWKENDMTNEKLEEILNTHHRTPYK
jgi:uncharacterized protein YnzC (UPF0291/DUF896 family)